jgi:A/G-specific adenine glycosylase
MPAASFADRLIAWQQRHGRHDLPWQNTRDPYRVWLSEIMLQQTQVATVIPYYQRFLARFPDLAALAGAPVEEVMGLWSGLGYYARARNLHACAQAVVAKHGGRFPSEPEAIAALPGIGRSTANAIAVFCFGARAPILDGNVKRLLCRYAGIEGWPGSPAVESQSWRHATSLLPERELATYIQAQMDLGATICTRGKPKCELCPVAGDCVAKRDGRTAELPTAKPRKALPERETTMLVLVDAGRVLLLPRPPTGIWGGLLSLPEIADARLADAEAARLGCRIAKLQALAPVSHTFTHFRLTIHPLLCDVKPQPTATEPGARWLSATDLAQAPLPAPIRKLLTVLLDQPVV